MEDAYTASAVIEADPDELFAYVSNPANQPSWAVNFVRSTRPLGDGRWLMETPVGDLVYRVETDAERGVVDFVYESPHVSILPTRVTPHPRGSTFTFTITRASGMDDAAWEWGKRGLDEELEQLKRVVER